MHIQSLITATETCQLHTILCEVCRSMQGGLEGVIVGKEVRGNVPVDDVEVDREILKALDGEDMMGKGGQGFQYRPPV